MYNAPPKLEGQGYRSERNVMSRHNYNKDNWPSKFTITIDACKLASYTNKILDNKNTFPDGCGEEIVSRLRSYTMQIYLDCYQANDWRVMTADDYMQRRELQDHALDMCELCLPLIQLAKHHFHLETKRMMYWGKMVIDLRDKICAWVKSDRERYSKYV